MFKLCCLQGGLRAVVWADFIQALVMFGSMLLIAIKGTLDIGGLSVVLRRNRDSDRLEFPAFVFRKFKFYRV